MITGDHAVTAEAIGETLGLGPGAISGSELQALSDDELARRLPRAPRLRPGLARGQAPPRPARCRQQGLIVAMTGDAVNDAAALKQADIGVAMGSGSEVTKQAARMILTDDNFGTLVHAVEIGRRVYDKIVSYVRYQMTQLLALVMLFLAATVFDINEGVALTPSMVLYLLFFVTAVGVVIIAVDPGTPTSCTGRRATRRCRSPTAPRSLLWVVYGAGALRSPRSCPLVAGPGRAQHRRAERLDDDDVRGDGPRHGLQRADQPPRPGQRAHAADPARPLAIALVPVALSSSRPSSTPAARPAHPAAHRPAVAGLHRSRAGAPDRRRGRQVDPSIARA